MACFSAILFFFVAASLAISANSQNYQTEGFSGDSENERNSVLMDAQDRQNAFNKIPTSCSDLASIGRMENGLHLLKGPTGIKVSFCDFTKMPGTTGYETEIGYHTDLKTKSVFFQAFKTNDLTFQKDKAYALDGFSHTSMNTDNCFDVRTGFFTAPVTGKYMFLSYVPAMNTEDTPSLMVCLKKNDSVLLRCARKSHKSGLTSWLNQDIQHVETLSAGERVRLEIVTNAARIPGVWKEYGIIFTGYLIEEDLTSKISKL